jgi:hypothetical protein
MCRQIAACLAALAVAVASVADNSATCAEDAGTTPDCGAPVCPPLSCAGMPCQTPGVQTWPLPTPKPQLFFTSALALTPPEPVSADAPPPPTPPPTALS